MSGNVTAATMETTCAVECSMCGDVGFPEQLHQCKACPRVQHIYCSISKDGLETGDWLCDWCRAERQRKLPKPEKQHVIVDMKETTRGFSQCTLNSPDSGLEFLIKAVLSSKDEFFPTGTGSGAPPPAAGEPSPTADCGSNCSSSVESEKVNVGMQSASCGLGDASSKSRERRVTISDTCISDEEGSIGTIQMRTTSAACDIKRSPSSLRCSVRGSKGTKQKQLDVVKTLKSQLSLPVRHSGPAPLKRLSSLKVLSRASNITIEENPPRGLVRRYKSLSDICY